jgi:hypothetical protein
MGLLQMAGAAPLKERKNDLYETPSVATEKLIQTGLLPPGLLWDPCCGPGAISKVLRANDWPVVATDLVDYGFKDAYDARIDFLMTTHKQFDFIGHTKAIVMNPPFKLAAQFVRHALDLGIPDVFALTRIQFQESAGRSDILDKPFGRPARILVLKDRLPMMHREGWQGPRIKKSALAYQWIHWNRWHRGPTEWSRI